MILRSKCFITELSHNSQFVNILIVCYGYYNGGVMQNRTLLDRYSGEFFFSEDFPDGVDPNIDVSISKDRSYINTHIKDFGAHVKFGKIYVQLLPFLRQTLTDATFCFMFDLITLSSWNECILKPNGDGRCNAISTLKELATVLGKKYNVVHKHIDILKKEEIVAQIYKYNDPHCCKYYFNPYIYFRGKDLVKTTNDLFKDSKWARLFKKIQEDAVNMDYNEYEEGVINEKK